MVSCPVASRARQAPRRAGVRMGPRLRKWMEQDTRGAGSLACAHGHLYCPQCLEGSVSTAWGLDLGAH